MNHWTWAAPADGTKIYSNFQDGTTFEKIAPQVSKRLHDARRKVFKQLAKKGVPFEQLVVARATPGALNQLVKKTGNHPFAVLFQDVCRSESTNDTEGVLKSFVWAAWETVSDQIEHRLASRTQPR